VWFRQLFHIFFTSSNGSAALPKLAERVQQGRQRVQGEKRERGQCSVSKVRKRATYSIGCSVTVSYPAGDRVPGLTEHPLAAIATSVISQLRV
jgi:hypothetical protein